MESGFSKKARDHHLSAIYLEQAMFLPKDNMLPQAGRPGLGAASVLAARVPEARDIGYSFISSLTLKGTYSAFSVFAGVMVIRWNMIVLFICSNISTVRSPR